MTDNTTSLPNTDPRLNTEWLALHMLREGFSIASGNSITYGESLVRAIEIAPQLFDQDSLLRSRAPESLHALVYREKSELLKFRNIDKTPVQLVTEDITEISDLLSTSESRQNGPLNTQGLRRRLNELEAIRSELLKEKYSETQLITRDAAKITRNLPVSEDGRDYRQYELPHQKLLRVRYIHLEPAEGLMGGDVIYELYDEKAKRVRLAVFQYKLWDGKRVRKIPSEAPRMERQLSRLKAGLCDSDLCISAAGASGYRLPFCAAFLRPTDALQNPTSQFTSTGYHIPVCQLDNLWQPTGKGGHVLEYENFKNAKLSTIAFEEFFNDEMAGSRWLTYQELEDFFRKHKILNPDQNIKLHIQVTQLAA